MEDNMMEKKEQYEGMEVEITLFTRNEVIHTSWEGEEDPITN